MSTIDEIHAHLVAGDLRAALSAALKVPTTPHLNREILAQLGRLSDLEARTRAGELTAEAASVERNRIRMALLDWVELSPAPPEPASKRGAPATSSFESALADFFLSSTTPDELRFFLRSWEDLAPLEPWLPGSSSTPAGLAQAAAQALIQHNLVGPSLFDRIEGWRPGRAADIKRLRERWSQRG